MSIDNRTKFIICRCKRCGSLTVEAAAIVPVFVIGLMALISINLFLSFYLKMQQALFDVNENLSLECADGHNEAISDIEDNVIAKLDQLAANYTIVRDGKGGLDFSSSRVNDSEYLQIIVSYDFIPFGAGFFGLIAIPIKQTCLMHVWCGYEKGFFSEIDNDYVYITEASQVYHLNRECSHIKLSVSKINASELDSLRNNNGAKYYSCDICHSKPEDSNIYITAEGSRYHNSVTCSGLKRTVRAVRKSQITGRRPCQRCGK